MKPGERHLAYLENKHVTSGDCPVKECRLSGVTDSPVIIHECFVQWANGLPTQPCLIISSGLKVYWITELLRHCKYKDVSLPQYRPMNYIQAGDALYGKFASANWQRLNYLHGRPSKRQVTDIPRGGRLQREQFSKGAQSGLANSGCASPTLPHHPTHLELLHSALRSS